MSLKNNWKERNHLKISLDKLDQLLLGTEWRTEAVMFEQELESRWLGNENIKQEKLYMSV